MGLELCRHLGADAEPALEARHRLVKQHAETVHDAIAPGPRGGKKLRLEWAVDDVGDHRV